MDKRKWHCRIGKYLLFKAAFLLGKLGETAEEQGRVDGVTWFEPCHHE
jgi:hypothetical protein